MRPQQGIRIVPAQQDSCEETVRDMKRNNTKEQEAIAFISLIAPLPIIVILSLYYGMEFLVIAIAPYSIMFGVTFVLMLCINLLFKKTKLNTLTRLLVACASGLIIGGLFFNAMRHRGLSLNYFGDDSMILGAILGLVTSFFAFILYSFGPWQIKVK